MKKAYSSIELIFVIVIIAILAGTTIPKLAVSRDEAEAKTCTREVGQLINEIATEYTKQDYKTFVTKKVSAMTNINIISTTSATKGIAADVKIDGAGIVYKCDNTNIATISGAILGSDYNLIVTIVLVPGTPVSNRVAKTIIKNTRANPVTGVKIYKL